MRLSVNTDAAVRMADRLERMSDTAMLSVVKQTLTHAAYKTKTDTLLRSAKSSFVERESTFFKANSRYDKATGTRISDTYSEVYMKPIDKAHNKSVQELETQETGGDIENKSMLPLDRIRTSKSRNKRVVEKFRNSKIRFNKMIDANESNHVNKKQKFVRAAFQAFKLHGSNALVMGNLKNGRATISRIDSIYSSISTGKLNIKRTPLYSYKKGFASRVTKTDFMKRAAHEATVNLDAMFVTYGRRELVNYFK